MDALLQTLHLHLTGQLSNTLEHVAAAALMVALLLAAETPWRRAVGLTLLFALLREFAYQLPFRDDWHLKLSDRLWDVTEWGGGALVAAGGYWLIDRLQAAAALLRGLLVATPAARA